MKQIYTDLNYQNIIGNTGDVWSKISNIIPDYHETLVTFSEPGIAEGSIKTYELPNMEVSLKNIKVDTNLTVQANDGVRRMGSTFMLRGKIHSDSIRNLKQEKITHAEHLFYCSSNYENEFIMRPGFTSLLHITLKPEFVTKVLAGHDVLNKVFGKNSDDEYLLAAPLNFSPVSTYRNSVNSIISSNLTGLSQLLFVESKVLEIFSLEIEDLVNWQGMKVNTETISRADREKLYGVYEYVENNFTNALSLTRLAADFQLNDFKLKKGYKILFGTTVFSHIYTLRMHKAKSLLESGICNVSEVSYLVGYDNPANFSTAFMRMYRYPPSRVLQNKRGSFELGIMNEE